MTDNLEIHQGANLPAVNLQNAIDSAVTLGRDGVEVLERLQSILKMERDHAAYMEFQAAKRRVLMRFKPPQKRGKRALAPVTRFDPSDLPANAATILEHPQFTDTLPF